MGSIDLTEIGRFQALRAHWNNEGNLLHTLGLLCAMLLVFATAQGIYRIWFHPLSKFPGPLHMSLVAFPALYTNHIRGRWVREVARLHRKYGPAVRIGPNHLSLDGSIGWPEVYSHRSGGRSEYQKLPPLFKDDAHSLIVAPREVHRRQRKQLAHAFSESALIQQEKVIMQFVDMLLEKLSERAKTKEPLNIVQWLNFTTFDIIGELSFSEPFFCLENNGYHPWVSFIFRGIQGAALRRFLHYYPLLEWLVQTVNLSSKMKSILQIRSSAKDKAKARMAHGLQPLHDHADFIYYMLKPTRDGADGMSAKEALANSPTLVIAGSETTATALSGFCFYISRNAKAYALLAGEIRAAFAQEEDINLRSTASLEYLQACINEILRVYPPAAETSTRVSPGDMIDGRYVPAGAYISVYQWATFRNPENFVEPDSYLPERWLSETHELYEERFSSDKRAVFKPFSHGPRDCIGKNLAFAEMRLIICRLLLRFDFELAHPQDHWHDNQRTFGLWEKGPLYLRLTERSVTE